MIWSSDVCCTFCILGVGPKVDSNTFDDLLGSHNFTAKPKGPTSLKDMKADQLVTEMDPDKVKVVILQRS